MTEDDFSEVPCALGLHALAVRMARRRFRFSIEANLAAQRVHDAQRRHVVKRLAWTAWSQI